jgi:hypothetical protein
MKVIVESDSQKIDLKLFYWHNDRRFSRDMETIGMYTYQK